MIKKCDIFQVYSHSSADALLRVNALFLLGLGNYDFVFPAGRGKYYLPPCPSFLYRAGFRHDICGGSGQL